MTEVQLTRREKTIEILKEKKIPYIEHLPCTESSADVRHRTAEEIARRAVACLIAIQGAFDLHGDVDDDTLAENKDFYTKLVKMYDAENYLSKAERKVLFEDEITQQEKINMMWKYEAYWVLLWCLGVVEELEFPSEPCDCEFAFGAVSVHPSFDDFLKTCKIRGIEEILDQCDLIYRYHWACVDARLNGAEPPQDMDSSVVIERHRALNWLIDIDEQDDWDNISTHT